MGFNSNDGFTRVPNKVIDEAKLNPYQFQLFSIIVRKTDGWCKVEDGISLSQFEKMVTFKKPKIISTLKELEDLGYIKKQKHYNEASKIYSYSTYRISDRVVTENNKGSNSELQGVVTEDYIQKKLNTKKTNTKKINPLLSAYMEADASITENGKNEILEFIEYRKKIKKPIRTIAPIKAYVKVIRELIKDGYKIEAIKDLMQQKEWQNIESEWVKKSLKKDSDNGEWK